MNNWTIYCYMLLWFSALSSWHKFLVYYIRDTIAAHAMKISKASCSLSPTTSSSRLKSFLNSAIRLKISSSFSPPRPPERPWPFLQKYITHILVMTHNTCVSLLQNPLFFWFFEIAQGRKTTRTATNFYCRGAGVHLHIGKEGPIICTYMYVYVA